MFQGRTIILGLGRTKLKKRKRKRKQKRQQGKKLILKEFIYIFLFKKNIWEHPLWFCCW
jgi:hypothetical protein